MNRDPIQQSNLQHTALKTQLSNKPRDKLTSRQRKRFGVYLPNFKLEPPPEECMVSKNLAKKVALFESRSLDLAEINARCSEINFGFNAKMFAAWFSNGFNATTNSIRQILATLVRKASPPPRPTVNEITDKFRDKPMYELVGHAFVTIEPYLEYEVIANDIAKDPESESRYHLDATIARRYANRMNSYPSIALHGPLVAKINNLVRSTARSSISPINYHTFVHRFHSLMMWYACQYGEMYNTLSFSTLNEYEAIEKKYDYWLPNETTEYFIYEEGSFELADNHSKALLNLQVSLLLPDVPEEVVLHVLAQSLSTAGLALIGTTDFPLFINLLPVKYAAAYAKTLWNQRYPSLADSPRVPVDPQNVDDSVRLAFETRIATLMKDFDLLSVHALFQDAKRNENFFKNLVPEPTPQGVALSASPLLNHDAPDDSDYRPDPVLAFKVRDFVTYIKSLDVIPEHKDHMKRFSTTFEQPVPLTTWQVRKTDARVHSGESSFSPMFVITFTRRNRVPIFNPVM